MWKRILTGGIAASMILTQPISVLADPLSEEDTMVSVLETQEEYESGEAAPEEAWEESAAQAETDVNTEAAEESPEEAEENTEAVDEDLASADTETDRTEAEEVDSGEAEESEEADDTYPEDTETEAEEEVAESEAEEELPELMMAAEDPEEGFGKVTISLALTHNDPFYGVSSSCQYADHYLGLFMDPEGTEPYDSSLRFYYNDTSLDIQSIDYLPYGTYYVFPMEEDDTILPYNEGIVYPWYEDNCYEDTYYAAEGTNRITINSENPTAALHMFLEERYLLANTAYDGEVSIRTSVWDSNHEHEIEPESFEYYVRFLEVETEDPYIDIFSVFPNDLRSGNLMLREEGPTYYDVYITDANGDHVYTEEEDFPYIVTGEGIYEFNHAEGDVYKVIDLEFREKETIGTVDVSVEQKIWDWYEEGYLGLLSNDIVTIGLYYDEEGQEPYREPVSVCFEDDCLQNVRFENVQTGTYYILMGDRNGVVYQTNEQWAEFHESDHPEDYYQYFSYETVNDTAQMVTITEDQTYVSTEFVLRDDFVVPGYSYAGQFNLTVTCWDSEHKNMIEPEENFEVGFYRNGFYDYEQVLSHVDFGETMSYPILIADEGLTYYDVYFVKTNIYEDGWSVSVLEDMDYTVSGNQHIEFNPDEGIYEVDINLELQKKAAQEPDPVEPSAQPEVSTPDGAMGTARPVGVSKPAAQVQKQTVSAGAVQTGDDSQVGFYLTLIIAALAGMAAVVRRKYYER